MLARSLVLGSPSLEPPTSLAKPLFRLSAVKLAAISSTFASLHNVPHNHIYTLRQHSHIPATRSKLTGAVCVMRWSYPFERSARIHQRYAQSPLFTYTHAIRLWWWKHFLSRLSQWSSKILLVKFNSLILDKDYLLFSKNMQYMDPRSTFANRIQKTGT